MERTEMLDKLNELIQLDVDAVEAYDHAVKHVDKDIKKRFSAFQDDHRAHIRNLSELVQQLGGKPVHPSPDLKGYLMEGLTALMSLTGTGSALEAMKTNERKIYWKYDQAVQLDFPEDVMKLLRINHAQEARHLTYIEEILTIPRREL
ncbi:MAG TPA: ferritin [Geobacter sp.]|nr:ferritin [Geobacter sp.]